MEISEKIANYLTLSKKRKTWPPKDERLPLLLKNTKSEIFPAYCEFSLSICIDIEPFLNLFQSEKPLAVFLYTKLKELIVSLLERFVKPSVLEQNSSQYKLLQFASHRIILFFAAKVVLRKLATVEKTLERQFRKESQTFLVYLIKKPLERWPWRYHLIRLILLFHK